RRARRALRSRDRPGVDAVLGRRRRHPAGVRDRPHSDPGRAALALPVHRVVHELLRPGRPRRRGPRVRRRRLRIAPSSQSVLVRRSRGDWRLDRAERHLFQPERAALQRSASWCLACDRRRSARPHELLLPAPRRDLIRRPAARGATMSQPRMTLTATVLGAPDPRALAAFYVPLLALPPPPH